ncbi:Crotonobetainyl-CoA:carnitine CoA-transferase CaiB [Microbulbifer thermotolerans]|uniref:CaiB/BaiF CoA transferase family protein n=1 Tax=Microbulbifer thermotolerans TaxID=252514 RepID=UPI0008E93C35|nr:CaiB/BaiF CoA-transferase family protein [Microbulbifer thermotolerans]MCX2794856.1 CoA transferase [Microbulbifer thermotolerans]SFC76175.1 Crotonobetainyl-CoA:carnitine CoA-transferase CaiB [Microbulbifer thermotolerans]
MSFPSKPLDGCLVLDFSQYLSGPSAALRLADLGARVIKIERPDGGDDCRKLYLSDCTIEGESTLFHAINRDKESFCADLKDAAQRQNIHALIRKADVIISNFRPGVMDRLELNYDSVKAINPRIVYGEITGYGKEGPWKNRPGQDLLLQALSGITWLSGSANDGPVAMGVPVADIFTGALLVQGILAALFARELSGEGAYVEISMLEAMLDFQFEPLTILLHDPSQKIERAKVNGAHTLVAGAYGFYRTSDGYIALSMGQIKDLARLLDCPALLPYTNPSIAYSERDAIKAILADHLPTQPTAYWLSKLEPEDIWCAEVLNWDQLLDHQGFIQLDMLQSLPMQKGTEIITSRCPIRIDDERLWGSKPAPKLGQNQAAIQNEINNNGAYNEREQNA